MSPPLFSMVLFDLKAWEKLDPELQEIVTRGAAATNMFILSKFQAIEQFSPAKTRQ